MWKIILDKIVSKVNEAVFTLGSILPNEIADMSGIKQFSLSVRYIEKINSKIILKEDILIFVSINDIIGKGL